MTNDLFGYNFSPDWTYILNKINSTIKLHLLAVFEFAMMLKVKIINKISKQSTNLVDKCSYKTLNSFGIFIIAIAS